MTAGGPPVYEGRRTARVVFPLGGIGAGSIGFAGDGRLTDWEIRNRPDKSRANGFSFFAVKAEAEGELRSARVLQGDLMPPYEGAGAEHFRGFGFGPPRETLAGLPHFESSRFTGTFPTARLDLRDAASPVAVTVQALSPFIPLDSAASSLPCALFTFGIDNLTDGPLAVGLVGCVANPHRDGAVNGVERRGAVTAVRLGREPRAPDDPSWGEVMLSTDAPDVSYQTYWYRGDWFDNLERFWDEFTTPGRFADRVYAEPRRAHEVYNAGDTGLLCAHAVIPGRGSACVRMAITWYFPTYENYWRPTADGPPRWRNAYAVRFSGVDAVTDHVWRERDRLEADTRAFAAALHESSLPPAVRDAVASNLAVLHSPTVARLPDGTLYGFEGCHADAGCCEGSCTHVWNYDQATPFLFPDLARSMREAAFGPGLDPSGRMAFRLLLPLERTRTESTERAAADGQMGEVVKVLREWRVSGDTAWMVGMWPKVKAALAYAWRTENPDGWDRDRDGVMEGCQHCTLDVELFGPNAYLTGIYHAALAAAAVMAAPAGDDPTPYLDLQARGRAWVDRHLWNGEYFVQRVDLARPAAPRDPELGEAKYQIGGGCHIDQVIGQWMAHVCGLGRVFEPARTRTALASLYRYNFRRMRDHANPHRIYALNDERGLVIATWPRGDRPKIPVPYSGECMNGYEYQAASHMIYEGLVAEGIRVAAAVRERYDGERRNPYNEFECGSNYARSMASYALLLALSGFEYDMSRGHLGFSPALPERPFRVFWCVGGGWGTFTADADRLHLEVWRGGLRLASFRSEILSRPPVAVTAGGEPVAFAHDPSDRTVRFAVPTAVAPDRPLDIILAGT